MNQFEFEQKFPSAGEPTVISVDFGGNVYGVISLYLNGYVCLNSEEPASNDRFIPMTEFEVKYPHVSLTTPAHP